MLRTSEWYFRFWIAHFGMWDTVQHAAERAGNVLTAAKCAEYAFEAQANAIGYASR